jgi:hypothetical protein
MVVNSTEGALERKLGVTSGWVAADIVVRMRLFEDLLANKRLRRGEAIL